ncbi:hypothetical protein [Paenibacillus polymyxa]|uniref:hypothetical protein n=1 Tax=Paenibacillus polymyxa TaxID=1406 RepID=UPI002AB436AF|nr:hypothetical protein [Paenibacillus polymyxa]MDY8023386.1 hypothetical protein [Paenibacillus polymyxa]
MATSFEEIYDVFLSQISDVEFIEMDTNDEFKYRYLLNSIARFHSCKSNLKDRMDTEFTSELTDQEVLILGLLMTVEYLSPKIISLKNLEQAMSTRDFSITSQAAHLKQLLDMKKDKQDEVERLITYYSYANSDLSRLR